MLLPEIISTVAHLGALQSFRGCPGKGVSLVSNPADVSAIEQRNPLAKEMVGGLGQNG